MTNARFTFDEVMDTPDGMLFNELIIDSHTADIYSGESIYFGFRKSGDNGDSSGLRLTNDEVGVLIKCLELIIDTRD